MDWCGLSGDIFTDCCQIIAGRQMIILQFLNEQHTVTLGWICRLLKTWMRKICLISTVLLKLQWNKCLRALEEENLISKFLWTKCHLQDNVGYIGTNSAIKSRCELWTWFGWDAALEELDWDTAGKAFTDPENLFSGDKPLFHDICLTLSMQN